MVGGFFKKGASNACKDETLKKDQKFEHPKLQAGVLSNIFFCWTFSSLYKGYTSGFVESDLFPPLPQHQAYLLGEKLEQIWAQTPKNKQSLWRALMKLFGAEFLTVGIIIFMEEFIVRLSQPVLIWKLINTHTPNSHKENESYIYAFLLILASFIKELMFNWHIFLLKDVSIKVKIACSSLIYRKSLKLDKSNVNKTPTGGIVNLLSNDLNRFDKLFLQLHYLWAAPVDVLIIVYLLYLILGLSATVGISVFCLFIPMQILMGRKFSQFRLKAVTRTDKRVSLISEIISGIQIIKMHTWEEFFINLTNGLRKEEIRYIGRTSYLKATQDALNKFLYKGAIFICILFYVLTGNHLHPTYVFVLKSFYSLLKQNMTKNFPEAIKNISELVISIGRLEHFLLSKETQIKHLKSKETGVFLEMATPQTTLSKINFQARKKQLIAIVGPVGSGKTTLINTLLQELPLVEGTLALKGRISFAGQEPWLFAGTVKENILFGQPLDNARYQDVVRRCALSTDFQLLPFGDNSIIGDKGITLSGGQKARIGLARAMYNNADIYILDDPLAAVDASVGRRLFEECILRYLESKCVVLVTHQLQYLQKANRIYLLRNGKVAEEGTYQQILEQGSAFGKMLEQGGDEEDSCFVEEKAGVCKKEEKLLGENKYYGRIPGRVFKEYLFSEGWCLFSFILGLFLLSQGVQSGTDYFESLWVNLEERKKPFLANWSVFILNNCVYIYSGLIFFILLFSIATSTSFYCYFLKSAVKLHDQMLLSVLKSKLAFFCSTSFGSILNRFSKDMDVTDSSVPKYLIDTIQNGLHVLSIFIIVAIVNPWNLLSAIVLLSLFYFMRTIYLSTSRELKRLEAISRSPIYSLLSETLAGLETIRAFNVQDKQKKKYHELLDRNASAFYMYVATTASFSLWLCLFCSLYESLVVMSCFWGQSIYGGGLGLMITQAASLAELLQWGMIQWSQFENEMISVERIMQYKDLEGEERAEQIATWSESTSIEFQRVSLRYKNHIPVLRNLEFCVGSREKVGIVGRTGAGKSSIIAALFRLVDFQGCVLIGGVNTKDLEVRTVRQNISIIPQDPVLFSGTVRQNLDPFSHHSDSDLWSILEDLNLKILVSGWPEGLESVIVEKGGNLSVGQRQLFCLARALLRKNKILVLDEATASVDFETDFCIQRAIKSKLVDCTVLVVAHRLHTIMDCDKVLVLEAGEVLEFDHPHRLLENENSGLYQLVAKTGGEMQRQLKEIAEKSYAKKHP